MSLTLCLFPVLNSLCVCDSVFLFMSLSFCLPPFLSLPLFLFPSVSIIISRSFYLYYMGGKLVLYSRSPGSRQKRIRPTWRGGQLCYISTSPRCRKDLWYKDRVTRWLIGPRWSAWMNIQCTWRNNYIPASGRAVSPKRGASLVDRSVPLTLSPSLLVLCPSLACKASWCHAYRHQRRCKLASFEGIIFLPALWWPTCDTVPFRHGCGSPGRSM